MKSIIYSEIDRRTIFYWLLSGIYSSPWLIFEVPDICILQLKLFFLLLRFTFLFVLFYAGEFCVVKITANRIYMLVIIHSAITHPKRRIQNNISKHNFFLKEFVAVRK